MSVYFDYRFEERLAAAAPGFERDFRFIRKSVYHLDIKEEVLTAFVSSVVRGEHFAIQQNEQFFSHNRAAVLQTLRNLRRKKRGLRVFVFVKAALEKVSTADWRIAIRRLGIEQSSRFHEEFFPHQIACAIVEAGEDMQRDDDFFCGSPIEGAGGEFTLAKDDNESDTDVDGWDETRDDGGIDARRLPNPGTASSGAGCSALSDDTIS